MKKNKSILKTLLIASFISCACATNVFATSTVELMKKQEYNEEFKKYLNLSEEERKDLIEPRSYKIYNTKYKSENLFNRLKASALTSSFSLRSVIPNNTSIKNQMNTGECWCFATLGSLETNLALKYGDNKIYDFSERHMDYATSRTFLNNEINQNGFNREVSDGGDVYIGVAYLTNGSGAVLETDMPFEDNENKIDIKNIQGKNIASQVFDTKTFPEYSRIEGNTDEVKNEIKTFIKTNGALSAAIHGAELLSEYYNNSTGALYCDDARKCELNHLTSIIGWDDQYPVENFNLAHRPQNPGAWIIRNSWGEKYYTTLTRAKQITFNKSKQTYISEGKTSASMLTEEDVEKEGFVIEDDKVYINVGDKGLMYISYEDVNIYSSLDGIEKAFPSINYENLYQHDFFGPTAAIEIENSKIYIGEVFDRDSSKKEFINQISISTAETSTCKVYVNPNGSGMNLNELQLVSLKNGNTQTFDAGYHTIEFAKPIKLNSNSFAVVVEIQGSRQNENSILLEAKLEDDNLYDYVKLDRRTSFVASEEDFLNNVWVDLSETTSQNAQLVDGDATIKAFTISNYEEPIQNEQPSGNTENNNNEEKNVETANFSNAYLNIYSVDVYNSSNKSDVYYIINTEIQNISRSNSNDGVEYYYYLSPNSNESDIQNWIKIQEIQKDTDKIKFEIDTRKISDFNEIENSNNVYLYVREVATKGGNQKISISTPMEVKENNSTKYTYYMNGAEYFSNSDVDGSNIQEKDSTDSYSVEIEKTELKQQAGPTILPKTGSKTVLIVIGLFITVIGGVMYFKYKRLNI